MPLYMCNAVRGVIPPQAKVQIANDITDIHCDMTGAPRHFVHVFFFEDAPNLPIQGKSVMLFGSIRAGRSAQLKEDMFAAMKQAIRTHTQLAPDEVIANSIDVPASWVMEGGEVLPEPGEEAAWQARHGV